MQFNEIKNKMNKQKKFFTKEIKIIKKNQTEILELKDAMNNKMGGTRSICNRANQMGKG